LPKKHIKPLPEIGTSVNHLELVAGRAADARIAAGRAGYHAAADIVGVIRATGKRWRYLEGQHQG